jgi:hypothetical protein
MRQQRLFILVLTLGLFPALIVGCGENIKPETDDQKLTKDQGKVTKGGPALKTLRAGKGVLKGKVILEGGRPNNLDALNKALATAMTKDPTQKGVCYDSASEAERQQQDWRLADDGGLADVFVYLKPIKGSFFGFDPEGTDSDKKLIEEAAKHNPVIDQPHCNFIPHAQMLWPSYRNLRNKEVKPVQELIVRNGSSISHNFKILNFNENFSPVEEKKIPGLTASYSLVPYGCSIHGWMTGNLLAIDHPYVAITSKDGSFEIKGLPVGKVLLYAVHGKAGFINANENKGEEIELTDGENTKSFRFTNKSR